MAGTALRPRVTSRPPDRREAPPDRAGIALVILAAAVGTALVLMAAAVFIQALR